MSHQYQIGPDQTGTYTVDGFRHHASPFARASSKPAVIPTTRDPSCGSVLKKAV